MNIKFLKDKPDNRLNGKVQACINRNIPIKDIPQYLKNTTEDIYSPLEFGEELLKSAAKRLISAISASEKTFLIQDSDCDGMTSAAHMINYLYVRFPNWVVNHLDYGLHKGKEHGINDFLQDILNGGYKLLIVPDAGTNDVEAIKTLHNAGCETIILDHHISDVPFSEYAITINSQYNYPNKQLSGVGVVHKFCQYLDSLLGDNYADEYLDLVAVGLMADMQSMLSLETKEMIHEGLKADNIKNPLIAGLRTKHSYSLSKDDYVPSLDSNLDITPIGSAFFITPFLNAICRSGTYEEKKLIFSAMLVPKAFTIVPSTKRGHKTGETERILDQALRTCTNVKKRQTTAEDNGMDLLVPLAKTMLDNKVLVFCLNNNEIDANVAGLVANKLAPKFQRPVCVTRKIVDNGKTYYAGSMRGYTATGINDFKSIAESSPSCLWCRGHENAAGLCITDPVSFMADMNKALKDVSTEMVYYVDYIWHGEDVDGEKIIDLAELNDYIGTDFPRPLVYVEDCIIDNFMIMKDVHLKINIANDCSAILWNAPEDLLMKLKEGQKVKINFVAKCTINNYNFMKSPQLIIEDYEIVKPNITEAWDF